MEFKRQRYQFGSLRSRARKNKPAVWQFRWYEDGANGIRVRRGKDIGTSEQYKTEKLARKACEALLLRLNSSDPRSVIASPSFGAVIDRYIEDERLLEIKKLKPGERNTFEMSHATVLGYLSNLEGHIRPRWGATAIDEIKAVTVQEWLRQLPNLSPLTRSHIRALMHRLFEKAMFWEIAAVERNPMDLVEIRGLSKRQKRPHVLTPEQYWKIYDALSEPFRTMSFIAVSMGLTRSEVSGLCWSNIDFERLVVLIEKTVVNGRIERGKNEYRLDELPLDPDVATVLLSWKRHCASSEEGWAFASPHTGRPYSVDRVQKKILKPLGEKLCMAQGLGWHTFRHTFRSWMDATGAPIGVQQKLMRHANVSTTMNVYGNALMKSKRETSGKVLEMIRRTG